MTRAGLFRLIIRRWYVFGIGLICVVAGILILNNGQRVFVAETEFVMVAPEASPDFQPPGDTQGTLVSFADIVARKLNSEEPTDHLSSPSATLFGNGVRSGLSAGLANGGTQWNSSFGSPVISVQVVDLSGEKVQERLDNISVRIARITREIQDRSGAKRESFITADSDPSRIIISSVGPTRTSKLKGEVVLMVVVLCLSTMIAAGLDRWRGSNPREPGAAGGRQKQAQRPTPEPASR